ncbi:MAG: PAS domain S-box protein [Acidobacteriota bacterium]
MFFGPRHFPETLILASERKNVGVAQPAAPSRSRWRRIYGLYCLLAALVFLAVTMALYFNYKMREINTRRAEDDHTWSLWHSDISRLDRLADGVGEPLIDVFEARDTESATEEIHAALSFFNVYLASFREKTDRATEKAERAQFSTRLDAVQANMREMAAAIEQCLTIFKEGHREKTVKQIAGVERAHAGVDAALDRLREDLALIEDDHLREQNRVVASLRIVEYGISTFLILMVAATALYGFKIARQAQFVAREKERYLDRLQKSEQKYRDLFENAVEGVFQSTYGGRFISANPALAKILGYQSAEELLMDHSEFISNLYVEPNRRTEYQRLMQEHGSVAGFESQIYRKDGTVIWISENACAVSDDAGKPARYEGFLLDITARKQAELALKESEERFREITENLNQVFWLATPDLTRMLYISPAYETIWGRTRQSLYENPLAFVEAIVSEDREPFLDALRKRVTQAGPDIMEYFIEFRISPPDGSVRWIESHVMPIRREDGQIGRLLGFARDISDRKRAEEELHASDERLKLALAASRMGVFEWDVQTNALFWSPECFAIFGTESFGGTMEAFAAFLHPEDAGRVTAAITRSLAEKVVHEDEFRIIRPDGKVRWQSNFAKCTYDLDGRPLRVVGTAQDITERKQAEEALLQSELRFRQFVERVNDIIYAIDLEGNFTALNRAGEEIVGPREKVGNVFRILAPEYVDLIRQSIVRVVRGESIPKIELEVFGTDGRRIVLEASTRLITKDGMPVGIDGIARDITQRKQAERMKSDFVSFVTHQLRTPLAGIKWLLELAAEGSETPKETLDFIQDARSSADRLIRLVNDLLGVSRLEQGKLAVVLKDIDLIELTRSVLDQMKPLIREKGITLSVPAMGDLPRLSADPQLLREAILNLVSNAMKYTLPGGTISIRIGQDDHKIRWEIEDSGIGVPKGATGRLFEKFYRAENAVSIETEGTGLGLYLVRLILERFGGRVWCESEEGHGATFLFTLPLAA